MADLEPEKHCATCICGRRASIQADGIPRTGGGTIAWAEHLEVFVQYARLYGAEQSAERIAERSGFGRREAESLLGRPLRTWEPR